MTNLALIGAAFGVGYAAVNVARFLPPFSLGELFLWGPPGPYPDGDRLPLDRCSLCYGDVRGECIRAGRCIFPDQPREASK